MKKLAIFLGVAIAIYVLVAIVAWMMLPAKIADAERRLSGVRVAIAQLSHDQQMVSERIAAISHETLGHGKSKIMEVAEILGDPDLNHLALTYMGSDWSLQRSSFLGQVAHARSLIDIQKDRRDHAKSRLDEKIKELEHRKRALSRRLHAPSEERAWRIEMADIERQLSMFRDSNTYREYVKKDLEEVLQIEVHAKNEDTLFKLASEYQKATVGRLNEIMAEKLGELRWEENEPVRWRRVGSCFNIWPLNLILKIPMGGRYEKRL